MFNAIYFTYDGVYSGDYGLKIATIDREYVETTTAFAPTLSMAKGAKSKRFFYSGIDYEDSPEHQFSILSEDAITGTQKREILSWLTGRNGFRKLYIHQAEYDDVYFNCIFKNVDIIYVGGQCHGFTVTAKFDSIYCYGTPTEVVKNLGEGSTISVTIHNESDVLDDYVYPIVEFDTDIEIKNNSDNGRVTKYTSKRIIEADGSESVVNEKVTIDNELKIIEGTYGGDKLSNLNEFRWLRLKKGANKLEITGKGQVTIICPKYILLGF